MKALLETRNLNIGYRLENNERLICSGLNLRLEKGSFVALLGPNGSGKSTLIRTLCALLPPLSGQVIIEGRELGNLSRMQRARKIAVVLTDAVINPGLKVWDMVSYGRFPYTNWLGKLKKEDKDIINESLELVGMAGFAERKLMSLSDGEKQRVMIAKALAQKSNLVVLDEPTAHLDLINRVEIMKLLRGLAHSRERAILISTHELDLALQSADELWLLNDRHDILTGAPEDLVLNNAMQKVFARSSVDFDHLTGLFKIKYPLRQFIRFESDDEQIALWTGKALEKIGIGTEPGVENKSHLRYRKAEGKWEFSNDEIKREFLSLAELIDFFRNNFKE